ncbi:MAG: L-lysine 6-transaminase [Candidatus Marinimicrobia bacterium]|jgi:L-lysine 6-transaminase|nr:L-lysine 6-transaminase [Candidatus Neomarinimicrobiota bacterium]|tara:strand:+ start:113 stop:1426 length:1314 start_codon:yes stop_codon:yes gene_type:complete
MIDARNVHAIIGKHMLADGMDQVIDLKKSHGSWLVDARDGKEYLDLFSMFASMPVGYNHPTMLENRERIADAALNKPTNSDIYSTQMAEFVDTVGRIAQPDYLPYAFFVEGGALGVENALKTAFDWKVRKNLAAGKEKKGSKVIHFRECFHGRTGYTMSLTDSPDPRKTLYFPQFDWPRITNPKLHFPLTDEVLEHILKAEATAINQIKSAVAENPDDIASLIIEPIQGEGGDNHFRGEFFQELRALADEHEFMLIYDEVQTGVGITGKMWAHQLFNSSARPDIICFGKKTQICGIFAGKRVDEVENNVFHESSRLNSTWGGNVVDMVRISLYLEIIAKEDLVNQAATNGDYLLEKLHAIQADFDGVVHNARGSGLFAAFDLLDGSTRDTLANLIIAEGALILGSGKKSIRFRPHLNITREEIDLADEIIRRALAKL